MGGVDDDGEEALVVKVGDGGEWEGEAGVVLVGANPALAEPAVYIAEDAEGNNKQVEILPGDQTVDFSIPGAPRK